MSNYISRTGRVQSWMDDPSGRLPVSCTVFVVDNEMRGPNGIEASWRFASHALRLGAGCAIHLSKLDPKGHERPSGVTASGAVSFGKIYSVLNETIRRGGKFKNGAIVLHYDLCGDDAYDFITTPRHELPWVKRCINITPEWWDNCTFKSALLHAIKSGDVWLTKVAYDNEGQRIYGNVCLEVRLRSRGTCLLQHINAGMCEPDDLVPAFKEAMTQLCELHSKTGVGDTGEYLDPSEDRQVGLGILGLANFLRRQNVTYKEFGEALEQYNRGDSHSLFKGFELASKLDLAIQHAAAIARSHYMVRAFAIAPTASCSFRSKDLDGYTCAPEIAPPIAQTVDRDSGTFGVATYEYGPVEIASEVGWQDYKRVADQLMIMYQRTGLLHGYSFNSWSDMVTYDNAFIEEWLRSPQTSLYYALQVMGDTQDKSDAYAAIDSDVVDDYLNSILNAKEEITCDCQE